MRRILLALAVVSALSATACDLDVPDLNNPSVEDLTENPTASGVNAAAVGLLIRNRIYQAGSNGYVSQLGIIGRESYNFDAADPRFLSGDGSGEGASSGFWKTTGESAPVEEEPIPLDDIAGMIDRLTAQ